MYVSTCMQLHHVTIWEVEVERGHGPHSNHNKSGYYGGAQG
jgi:hypothetical protein